MRGLVLSLVFIGLFPDATFAGLPITALAISPDGRQIVTGSQAGIELRNLPGLTRTATWPTELAHVHDLRFSPDGTWLLAAGGAPAEEGAVEIYRWPEGTRTLRVGGHDDVIYGAAWSPDGSRWATAGGDGVCQVFSAATGESLVRYEGHSRTVLGISYLPDSETIGSVSVDQTLRLWSSKSGGHIRTLDNHIGTVNRLAVRPVPIANGVSPGPTIVATISEDKTVRLWQPTIGRLMRFARLSSPPRAVVWSPAGEHLLVGCNDGHVRVLDPDTMQITREVSAVPGRIYELAVSPDGAVIVAGESGVQLLGIDRAAE